MSPSPLDRVGAGVRDSVTGRDPCMGTHPRPRPRVHTTTAGKKSCVGGGWIWIGAVGSPSSRRS